MRVSVGEAAVILMVQLGAALFCIALGCLAVRAIAIVRAQEAEERVVERWASNRGTWYVEHVGEEGRDRLDVGRLEAGKRTRVWSLPLHEGERVQFATVSDDGAVVFLTHLGQLVGIDPRGKRSWDGQSVPELSFGWIKRRGSSWAAWLSRRRVFDLEGGPVLRLQLPNRGPLCVDFRTGKPREIPPKLGEEALRQDLSWASRMLEDIVGDGERLEDKLKEPETLAKLFFAVSLVARYPDRDWRKALGHVKRLRFDDKQDRPTYILAPDPLSLRTANVLSWTAYTALRRARSLPEGFRSGTTSIIVRNTAGDKTSLPWKSRPPDVSQLKELVATGQSFRAVVAKLGAFDWYLPIAQYVYDCGDGTSVVLKFDENGVLETIRVQEEGYWSTAAALKELLDKFVVGCW
jgi:hypothetical protein